MSLESTRPGLKELIENFNQDRPAMLKDIPTLLGALMEEVKEAMEADEDMGQELADILIFTYTIAQWAGIDLEAETREKVAFNMVRYKSSDFQEGDYWEIRRKIKRGSEYPRLLKEFYSISK